jgi:hypothetical protein
MLATRKGLASGIANFWKCSLQEKNWLLEMLASGFRVNE